MSFSTHLPLNREPPFSSSSSTILQFFYVLPSSSFSLATIHRLSSFFSCYCSSSFSFSRSVLLPSCLSFYVDTPSSLTIMFARGRLSSSILLDCHHEPTHNGYQNWTGPVGQTVKLEKWTRYRSYTPQNGSSLEPVKPVETDIKPVNWRSTNFQNMDFLF